MKKIITIFGIVVMAAIVMAAPVKNLTFAWDADDDVNVNSYNFYEIVGGSTNLLGSTTNLTFTVSNVDLATAHTYVVTAVDGLSSLESQPSDPLTVVAPPAPVGLKISKVN